MTTLYDRIWALEHDLAKYPNGQRGALLNRRLILRKAFRDAMDEAREEGYTDGMKDAGDDARVDREIAEQENPPPVKEFQL